MDQCLHGQLAENRGEDYFDLERCSQPGLAQGVPTLLLHVGLESILVDCSAGSYTDEGAVAAEQRAGLEFEHQLEEYRVAGLEMVNLVCLRTGGQNGRDGDVDHGSEVVVYAGG